MELTCIGCGAINDPNDRDYSCRKCSDLLEVRLDIEDVKEKLTESDWRKIPLSVWRYGAFIPIKQQSRKVSLGEGGTRLHHCSRIGQALKRGSLYVKNEGENPTASFKDRGMTVGVTKAVELGAKNVVCASTGNTSASLSAYAAKAGLTCFVFIPSGKIAFGKLAQAMIYGARVLQVKGNFDESLEIVLKLTKRHKEIYLLNSVNPYRIEGQKTLAFEVCEQLGRTPDRVIVPVGNAGNISAIWKGFKEFKEAGLADSTPKMIGVQAQGAAPIVSAFKSNADYIEPELNPETVASAIRIGHPVSWKKALRAIRESKGSALTVSDEEILEVQKELARSEGLFVEPASASSVACFKKMLEAGELDRDETVVCVATGHGLKDPDTVLRVAVSPIEVEAQIGEIEKALGILSALK